VDSLTHAARIINATSQPGGIDALLATLGFTEQSHPLDAASRGRLGLPATVLYARISTGTGSLRAMSAEIEHDANTRETIIAIARQLRMHAPHLLWLVVVSHRNGSTLGVATWRGDRASPQIAAMITERGNVVDSDAETLCALSGATAAAVDEMRHMRWLDILGRDALTRRFFRALTNSIGVLAESLPSRVPAPDARQIAILTTSRLLFLSFLETKGWLNSDFGFLANGFTECMAAGGSYQHRVLEPLFFGTLNTRISERAPRSRAFGRIPFLNGGLFSRTTIERIHRHSRFSDDVLGALFGDVLVRYRFTAREDATTWSQAAIDPEMLGKVFESLMESGDRKRGGVFYTPQDFVERLTTLAFRAALERSGMPRMQAEQLLDTQARDTRPNPSVLEDVKRLRILDPACGSGAFLVYALERIARLRIALGDADSAGSVRRSVLQRSIFGVDSNPTAVWLCELRLWLSAVIDSDEQDPMRVVPLPNLDRQIRVGDSLSGDAFGSRPSLVTVPGRTSALRNRYTRSSGRRKLSLGRQLDAVERACAIEAIDVRITAARFERREILRAVRARDLFDVRTPPDSRQRDRLLELRSATRALRRKRIAIKRGATPAFAYPVHFADVAESGGFDVIIGNPPWVRVHNMHADDRARYRQTFSVFRRGGWSEGARGASAGQGFAGQTDLAALFVERSVDLLAPNGIMGLLLPSKLWNSLAGGGARQLVLERTRILSLSDYSNAPDAFEAAVYPSMLVAMRIAETGSARNCAAQISVQHRADISYWDVTAENLSLDPSPGSPWLLLPPRARASFDLLTAAGVPLFMTALGRPHLGVKTGCNDAFVVRAGSNGGEFTNVAAAGKCDTIESPLLRPLVRGETLTRWRLTPDNERIIWTHDGAGAPLRILPPHAHRWLARSRRALEQRSDSRSDRWWSLFRIESACASSPRVIWADFGRAPRAAVLDAGDPTVPLNTCYSVTCVGMHDALALAAILNSRIAAAWLGAIAEPARGGYHRYLGWTIARLPVPKDWSRAVRLLVPIAECAREGHEPDDDDLEALVLSAYDLNESCLAPLMEWTHACKNA
jgi:hypothetical protein